MAGVGPFFVSTPADLLGSLLPHNLRTKDLSRGFGRICAWKPSKAASRPSTALEGVLAVFGGIAALGAVLGVVALLLIQGRGDTREFGNHPGVFCTSAGGQIVPNTEGRKFCAIWVDPLSQSGN